jgi:hypothetical protein
MESDNKLALPITLDKLRGPARNREQAQTSQAILDTMPSLSGGRPTPS